MGGAELIRQLSLHYTLRLPAIAYQSVQPDLLNPSQTHSRHQHILLETRESDWARTRLHHITATRAVSPSIQSHAGLPLCLSRRTQPAIDWQLRSPPAPNAHPRSSTAAPTALRRQRAGHRAVTPQL